MSKFRLFTRTRTLAGISGLAAVILLSLGAAAPQGTAAAAAGPHAAGPSLDWPAYLHGPQHSSVSLDTAFTTANAGAATQAWHWPPAGQTVPELDASPTVAGGTVYIGAQSGQFYALSASTGAQLWSQTLDTNLKGMCGQPRGISATAAVLPDPVTGTSTVYVSGARDLYALNAATGAVVWKTQIGPTTTVPAKYYNWSSPTVVAGHIYVGLSSECDHPLVRGGVIELDQHTGKVLHTWFTVPKGALGGSVWSSVLASSNGSDVWVSTGNCNSASTPPFCPPGGQDGNSVSIVHLSPSLAFLQAWTVPTSAQCFDCDFGSSPILFGGSGSHTTPPDVGACNKNGTFYALANNPLGTAPLWARTISQMAVMDFMSCLASGIWDGPAGELFAAGNAPPGSNTNAGSVVRLDPAPPGDIIWQRPLPCAVMGSPSLDSAGVLAAGTYNCFKHPPPPFIPVPGAYLLDASNGAMLKTLPTGTSRVFAQPVFAEGSLFVATETGGLYAFVP
jgi:outer membrane protein assembly factor BamB